jgi:hypothetical protein
MELLRYSKLLLDILLRQLWDLQARRRSVRKHIQSLLVHGRIDHDAVKAVRAASAAVVELECELDTRSLEDLRVRGREGALDDFDLVRVDRLLGSVSEVSADYRLPLALLALSSPCQ